MLRIAWVILFAMGLIPTVAAIAFAPQGGRGREAIVTNLTGLTWDGLLTAVPGIGSFLAEVQRILDTYAIGFGVLVMVVAWVGYRKRERWAWYALWIVPLVLVSIIVNDVLAGMPASGFAGVPLVVLSLLALVLPYRTFFPART